MNSVFVYKTTVQSKVDIEALLPFLEAFECAGGVWSFDLEDCDRILRIESSKQSAAYLVKNIVNSGFLCSEL